MDKHNTDDPKKKIQKIREESNKIARQAIIKAAEHVFYRDGWIRGTVEDIAREAGLTKGGVLYYYRSKTDLLAAAFEWHMQRREDFIEKRLTEAGPGAHVGRTALSAWLDFVLVDESYTRILVLLTAEPALRARMFETRRKLIEKWCTACADPLEAATIFFMVEGLMLDCFHEKSAYPDEMRERLIEKIRKSIMALE